MSNHQAGTGPNPSPQNVGVASGQTVRIQQVLTSASQNVNVLSTPQFVLASQVNVPGITQVIPTIPNNNATIQQGVTRILNIAPSSRVNVVGVPQVPGRTASVQLTNTGNNASGEVSGRGAVSLVAISQSSAVNAASHPTLVSTLSSPPRQRTTNPLGIMQPSPTLVLTSSHNVRSPSSSHTSSHPSPSQSNVSGIPRKRIRLIEMQDRPPPSEEVAKMRKAIIEYKTAQMNVIREQFAERAAELFFLQLSGNMMDYFAWRKRPPSAQFLHFLRTNPLDAEDDDEDLSQVLSKISSASSTSSSDTKTTVTCTVIPSSTASVTPPPTQHQPPTLPPVPPIQQVSDTPSISTAVASGSASSFTTAASPTKQVKSPSVVRQPPKTQSISSVYDTSIGSQEQIAEKAKQEAHVMQRIAELQKEGLWSERRLPKVQEPPRIKAHWDYLIEEMVWLAADFAQERKWKKAAAKKCARAIQKYFQEKAIQAQKAEKTQEQRLRKIANFIAKEVKTFWSNVEKLVEYKQHTRLEEKRKKVLDQHLSFIVDQTERYSTWLAESMNKSGIDNTNPSVPPSVNSSVLSSPARHDGVSDDEFQPNQSSTDDEETIARQEEEEGKINKSHSDEIEMLKRESELPLEDLLKDLPEDYLEHREEAMDEGLSDDEKSSTNDDEFVVESGGESSDDEETIQEQEKAEGTVDHKEELAALEAEGEMSLEDLLAKYGGPECLEAEIEDGEENDSDDNSESESECEGDEAEVSEMEEEGERSSVENEEIGLKSLLDDANASYNEESDKNATAGKEINDVAALAESIQPKGNTLSSTNVVTKIPFLLKHSLREYQHIGLDWLVTMFDRKLNGILADEMGLGKTIQTISLLAHLACEKGNWGPHLIIVPTSVMLNWEMELKKWCPAFKILTYYGTQKERKQKRTGWTKPNAFHVCITSYKLVIQDHQSFRRKKWKYLILDEAQNIKNFKSQRWQLLLNFQTQRRLLLTGTPLQNNLMELWSLMHFLMPNVFQSHREFKEWFSNPVTGMIEGNSEYNDSIIKRLHKVLRPFLLRRLKSEVEKQLPKKYEHIVMCRLSKRQRFLYDDFMSRAKTKETLATGNLLSVINVLMQLRKVCNHPNLFEVRPTVSPFQMETIVFTTATLAYTALSYDPFKNVNLDFVNLLLLKLEFFLSAFVAHRIKKCFVPKPLIEEIDKLPDPPPRCPERVFKMNIRYNHSQQSLSSSNALLMSKGLAWNLGGPRSGLSPLLKSVPGLGPGVTLRVTGGNQSQGYSVQLVQQAGGLKAIPVATLGPNQQIVGANNSQQVQQVIGATKADMPRITLQPGFAQIVQSSTGRHLVLAPSQVLQTSGSQNVSTPTTVFTAGQRVTLLSKGVGNVSPGSAAASNRMVSPSNLNRPVVRVPPLNVNTSVVSTTSNLLNNVVTNTAAVTTVSSSTTKTSSALSQPTLSSFVQQKTRNATSQSPVVNNPPNSIIKSETGTETTIIKTEPVEETTQKKNLQDAETKSVFFLPQLEELRQNKRKEKLAMMADRNQRRVEASPVYGSDLRHDFQDLMESSDAAKTRWKSEGYVHCLNIKKPFRTSDEYFSRTAALSTAVHSAEQYVEELQEIFSRFVFCVPAVSAPQPEMHVSHPPPSRLWAEKRTQAMLQQELSSKSALLHPIASAMVTQFPDPRLIQYDCGKLQVLDKLLRQLKSEHHRVLIFTQMTRMLDVLEAFLNFHGHIYLRLDGTTRVDQRQVLMERFNADKRIFCFILSTRSGGIGVNLTGADTVIFYDSDWNPTMDAQAQDRCHRIGQTRDVHIYRLVSEMTVEENILKKANQKRLLGDLAIEGGNFTTAYFKSSTIQDLFNIDVGENDASRRMAEVLDRDSERRRQSDSQRPQSPHEDKVALGALESALAAAEDETDVLAARTAKAEAAADLAEFDENIPLEEGEVNGGEPEMSRAEQELNNIVQQLTPVERYAMKFVEAFDSTLSAEHLAAAEAEIEQQKKEWELGRLQALKEEEERRLRMEDDDDQLLTFSREDSQNQIWISDNCKEQMPMWCPPTPPQDDNDVYIDHSIGFLYEQTVMSESQLPPVYVKKEQKRLRLDNSSAIDRESRRPLKMRHREESVFAPRSLFDRPSPAIMKMRRDMKLQKYRGIVRNPLSIPGLKPPTPAKPLPDQDTSPEWLIHEDWALLQAIQEYLDLPLNLTVLSPAHTPNWDFVSDIVNNVSRTYRSPKQCRNRYEWVIIPREEGRLLYDVSPKKQKKNKNVGKPPQQTKTNRPMRTSQLYLQDNHGMYTRLYSHRFETIKSIANKKQSTTKPSIGNPVRNPKHASLLAENGVNYDAPLSPLEVAIKRAERIAKEKKVVQAQLLSEQRRLQLQQLQQQQQNKQQLQQLQQQQQAQQQAVAQAKAGISSTQQVSLGSVVSSPAASSSTAQATVVGINPNQELLGTNQVRAVTSSSGSLVTVASLNSAQVQVAAQRLATVSLPSQTQSGPISTPTKAVTGAAVTGSKPMSVQILRHMRQPGQHPHLHQQQLQQQQQAQQQQQQQHRLASHQQLKVLQAAQAAGQGVAPGQKVSVAMTSGTVGSVAAVQVSQATAQRVQQFMNMKQAAAAAASAGGVKQTVSRTVTDSEMAAIIKRQQQQQLVAQQKSQLQVASQPTLSQAQAHLLAQAGIPMQAGTSGQTQVATLVKAVSTAGGTTQSVTIPVTGMTLPQMKATFSPGAKGASTQQIRQLSLHPQILQQRKLPMQKVAQLTQVTGKGGVPTQLIVQSQKAMPTTVTVQQIQQVIKQVPPQTVQHITHVSGGQAVVSQASGSQMISHAVLAKGSQVPGATQTLQTRVIPMSGNQQGLKQTIQVVTAGPGGRTSVPNVTIDSAGRPTVSVASTLASALAGTIKVSPSPAQQQAILSQVSAALQGQHVQQIRQPGSSPMRIQAVAVQQQGQTLPAVIAQPNPSQTPGSQETPQ